MERLGLVVSANQFARSKSFLVINTSIICPNKKSPAKLLPGKRQKVHIIHRKTPGRGANRMDISRS